MMNVHSLWLCAGLLNDVKQVELQDMDIHVVSCRTIGGALITYAWCMTERTMLGRSSTICSMWTARLPAQSIASMIL